MAQSNETAAVDPAAEQSDIASVVATLASRQGDNIGRRLTGPERAAVLVIGVGGYAGYLLLDQPAPASTVVV